MAPSQSIRPAICMASSVLSLFITFSFLRRREVSCFLQPQDMMSRHRDLLPSALTIPSSRLYRELVFYRSHNFYKTSIFIPIFWKFSRYGVCKIRLPSVLSKNTFWSSPILTSIYYLLIFSNYVVNNSGVQITL